MRYNWQAVIMTKVNTYNGIKTDNFDIYGFPKNYVEYSDNLH